MYEFFLLSQAFGRVLDLVPLAESVVKLNAVCMHCFKDAAFTKRLGQEKKVGKKPLHCISVIDSVAVFFMVWY